MYQFNLFHLEIEMKILIQLKTSLNPLLFMKKIRLKDFEVEVMEVYSSMNFYQFIESIL